MVAPASLENKAGKHTTTNDILLNSMILRPLLLFRTSFRFCELSLLRRTTSADAVVETDVVQHAVEVATAQVALKTAPHIHNMHERPTGKVHWYHIAKAGQVLCGTASVSSVFIPHDA